MHGAALSSLLEKKSQNKLLNNSQCIYNMPVFNLDSICETFGIEQPKYLKIDVDGLEFNIIKGAKSVLKNIQSLLIEVDKTQLNQEKDIFNFLANQGFYLEKNDFEMQSSPTSNQIWSKVSK